LLITGSNYPQTASAAICFFKSAIVNRESQIGGRVQAFAADSLLTQSRQVAKFEPTFASLRLGVKLRGSGTMLPQTTI
jgi:hypothetical protein